MNNNKTEDNNYFLDFFNNLKLFYVQHGLARPEMFKGVSSSECDDLEKKFKVQFDPSLRSFLLAFGDGIAVPGFTNSSFFTRTSIEKAYAEIEFKAKEHNQNTIDLILNITNLDSIVVDSLDQPLKSVILLKYDYDGGSYILVEGGAVNPFIYIYYDYSDDLFFHSSRLTEHVRSAFSSYVLEFCRSHAWNRSNKSVNSLLNLDWVQFYELVDKEKTFWTHYSRYRTQFRYRNQEDLNDDNFDFNAGEERFINYLLDNKII